MIKQCFNYVDSTVKEMTDFFDNCVENLETNEDKIKSSTAAKKCKDKKVNKKQTKADSESKVM